MDVHSSQGRAAILGTLFGVWLMALIVLMSSGNWRAVAVAVVIGVGIVLVTRSASKAAQVR